MMSLGITKRLTTKAFIVLVVLGRAVMSQDVMEWVKYDCDNVILQGTAPDGNAPCFCGHLRDRIEDPQSELTEAELTSQDFAACVDGVAAGFPCQNVDLLSHTPLSDLGDAGEANDLWGWTDSASGREFVLLGIEEGTAFVEITDPTNPVYLGRLPSETFSSFWHDIKVYADHAFIVSEASFHGMQVFDLTQLLSVSTPTSFTATTVYNNGGKVQNVHNIAINEDTGFAYLLGGSNGCFSGLHMVDISTPANPTFAGCYGGDGYVHDAHCVTYDGPDSTYVGNEICFCSNEDTITVVDVTDKTNPVQLSRTSYGSKGYTHQGWLSEDHRYFIFGDETDELSFEFNTRTLVMDVQDLDYTILAGVFLNPTTPAIDHNLYVVGDFVYQANYRAGFRILKVEDLARADFTEIAYFDIFPSSDSNNFNGAWSVYPFFPSGNVIVSGIEQGLFVLSPDLSAIVTPTPSSTQTPAPTPTTTNVPAPAPTSGTSIFVNGFAGPVQSWLCASFNIGC